MQFERSHLYLLPAWDTGGVTAETNQTNSYTIVWLTHHAAQAASVLDAGPDCQQGPMEGFLLLTPGLWALCSQDESTAWFWLQA